MPTLPVNGPRSDLIRAGAPLGCPFAKPTDHSPRAGTVAREQHGAPSGDHPATRSMAACGLSPLRGCRRCEARTRPWRGCPVAAGRRRSASHPATGKSGWTPAIRSTSAPLNEPSLTAMNPICAVRQLSEAERGASLRQPASRAAQISSHRRCRTGIRGLVPGAASILSRRRSYRSVFWVYQA